MNMAFRAGATRPSVSAVLVVLVSVVLAACASNPTPAPSGSVAPSVAASLAPPSGSSPTQSASATAASSGATGDVDACALLPTADLSTIVAGPPPVATAMPGGGWIASQCAWNGPTSGFFLSVGTATSIEAVGDPAAADAAGKLAQFKTAAGTAKDVAGIGDGAALGANGMAATVGDTYLEITRLSLTDDQLAAIMKLAIANLR